MTQINAATFSAFLLTAVVLFLMNNFPAIPVWAVFLSWACFFHVGGGEHPRLALLTVIMHMGLGAVAAWLSALLLFANPFENSLANQLWGPVTIGIAIAILVRLSLIRWFAVTSAIIYGYASIWAFLSLPDRFIPATLQSLSLDNAVLAILFSILLGTCLGYLNTSLVRLLIVRFRSAEQG